MFLSTEISLAIGFGSQFGGRIFYTKAKEIQVLEWAGYVCPVLGSTIEIKNIGSSISKPTSYFIPLSTRAKTGYGLRPGQLIMGKYAGKMMITCTHPLSGDVRTVNLDTITLFGTSK